jgi:hypothetical protein
MHALSLTRIAIVTNRPLGIKSLSRGRFRDLIIAAGRAFDHRYWKGIVSALALPDPLRRRLIWFFGILGAIGFVLTLITYQETPNVPHFGDAWQWVSQQLVLVFNVIYSVIRSPIFLIALGIAVDRWIIPVVSTFMLQLKEPTVEKWLNPLEAINEYVDPTLIQNHQRAKAKLDKTQVQLNTTTEPEHVALLGIERDDAAYIEQQRKREVTDSLIDQLKNGHIIAKGTRIKKGKLSKSETIIHQHIGK